ncbi:acyltransferase family protein [Burkholderia pseudomallei]|uniref:acyltransferase family protein n=1 Tax=Burkholderia pseudomallei TaxID=28450 RepID=UPI000A4893EF|nr:acyltransferase [Burkholderia pseudomallei]
MVPIIAATKKTHFYTLDGLRGIAALAIAVYHNGTRLPWIGSLDHGWLAVDFFFVLSGFVIDHSYQDRLSRGMGFCEFLRIRAIRLCPMTIIGASLGLLLYVLVYHSLGAWLLGRLTIGWILTCLSLPATLLPDSMPPWIRNTPFYMNRPSWSLFFEWIASVAFAVALSKLRLRGLVAGIVVAGCLSILMAYLGKSDSGWSTTNISWGLVRVAYPFLIGILISRTQGYIQVPVISFPLASLLLLGVLFVTHLSNAWESVYDAVVVMLIFPTIVLTAKASIQKPAMIAVIQWLGFISFPLYATHVSILSYYHTYWKHQNFLTDMAAVGAAVLMAALLSAYVEIPTRQWLTTMFTSKKNRPPLAPLRSA